MTALRQLSHLDSVQRPLGLQSPDPQLEVAPLQLLDSSGHILDVVGGAEQIPSGKQEPFRCAALRENKHPCNSVAVQCSWGNTAARQVLSKMQRLSTYTLPRLVACHYL